MTVDHKAIRKALEKASPGPWLQTGRFTVESETNLVSMTKNSNDAHLIANAPEWFCQLLDENERLELIIKDSGILLDRHVEEKGELKKEIEQLKADKAALTDLKDAYFDWYRKERADKAIALETLRWYADVRNYSQPKPFYRPFIEVDKGRNAREALERLEDGQMRNLTDEERTTYQEEMQRMLERERLKGGEKDA